MDLDAALHKFEAHCPPQADPVLTDAQVAAAIAEAACVDADDLAPSDDGWTPTYSVIGVWRSIVRGWEMKLSNAAGRFDFTTDGQTFRRSQTVAHCREQADMHRRKLSASIIANASS